MAEDAKMVVAASGERWGTVGGGCTEADVTDQALAAARAGTPTFVEHTLNADLAGDLGLSCGGTVELFLEPIVASTEMAQLYGAVADAIEQRVPATVYTAIDWGSGPSKTAQTLDRVTTVGSASHAGSDLQRTHVRPAASFVDEDRGRFVEPIARLPRLVIFGAGHVGAEIARLAANVGFHVMVTDDRTEFANRERVPWADEIVVDDFRALLDRLTLDEDDYVLATTRGHSFDAYIIERTAASRARYVGMLGSRRKREVIFKALEEAGVPSEALERVKVPIGEPIGADTPAEIAVSVVAELIRVRRLGTVAGAAGP
jgi:xanthine dehydrogenase accessory factor